MLPASRGAVLPRSVRDGKFWSTVSDRRRRAPRRADARRRSAARRCRADRRRREPSLADGPAISPRRFPRRAVSDRRRKTRTRARRRHSSPAESSRPVSYLPHELARDGVERFHVAIVGARVDRAPVARGSQREPHVRAPPTFGSRRDGHRASAKSTSFAGGSVLCCRNNRARTRREAASRAATSTRTQHTRPLPSVRRGARRPAVPTSPLAAGSGRRSSARRQIVELHLHEIAIEQLGAVGDHRLEIRLPRLLDVAARADCRRGPR